MQSDVITGDMKGERSREVKGTSAVLAAIDELVSVVELKQVKSAAQARIDALSSEGLMTLATQFEQMAAEYGISAKKVLAEAGKRTRKPRGRRRAANDTGEFEH